MIVGDGQVAAAARAETPAVEHAHRHMMENRRMKKVVFVHSALGDSRLWRHQVDALRPTFEVVAPDLPGWGKTPLPTEAVLVRRRRRSRSAGAARRELVRRRGRAAHRTRPPGARSRSSCSSAPGSRLGTGPRRCGTYFAAEEARSRPAISTRRREINLEFWVAPEHHDEVRPQQRSRLELADRARGARGALARAARRSRRSRCRRS